MSLCAVCPACHVENAVSNVKCDLCGAALGALVVEGDRKTSGTWIAASTLITLLLYMSCYALGLHPVLLLVAGFYGPLLASYFAPTNIVYESSVGGLLGIVSSVAFIFALESKLLRALVAGLAGTDDLPSVVFALVIGVPLLLLIILPASLTGASVGEHLSVRRRRPRTPADSGEKIDLETLDPGAVKL